MKFYKVCIILFTYEGSYEFKTKYFSEEKIALEYCHKLNIFLTKFVRVLNKINHFFDANEDSINIYPRRRDMLYNFSNYDFTYNDSDVRIEEINISYNTDVIYKEESD